MNFIPPQPHAPFQVGEKITYCAAAGGLRQGWIHGIRNILDQPVRRFYDVVDDQQQLQNPNAYARPVHYSWVERIADGRFVYEA